MTSLKGKTLFISGGSRGIGLAIALRAARDGANVVIAAKTDVPHPKLKGTIHTAAAEINGRRWQGASGRLRHPRRGPGRRGGRAGGRAVRRHRHPGQQRERDQPDRDARNADEAVRPDDGDQHARHVPLLAGLHPASSEGGEPAHPDAVAAARHEGQMVRASRRLHDGEIRHEHVRARHGRGVPADGIAVNALWPRTTIATAAVGISSAASDDAREPHARDHGGCRLRDPDAASRTTFTGNFCIDDKVLYASGVRDFERYRVDATVALISDFFVPDDDVPPPGVTVQPLPSVGGAQKAR